ncbi:MAG: tRNA (adenosine(37)-N6)-threonylcarbamoyltransferase complex dimerization subunit type 1 TsaB [Oscillospiraceae bacterium]|nr:tRNA (adenosine(37)-N6)-threonylcarbamoyltransferase complex dimerization subunit type 1 TsaB [Oscillospiraceae bacterium]
MKILAIDTSSSPTFVSLFNSNKILAEFSVNTELKHGSTLMPMIDSIFKCSSQKLREVDLFAVSIGPGSFTGLRVGISTIKGMAMVFSTPCVGISSLQILAESVGKTMKGVVICIVDAKCGRFWVAVFKNCTENFLRETKDLILDMSKLLELVIKYEKNNKVFLTGDAASLCYCELKKKIKLVSKVFLVSEDFSFNKASAVFKIAKSLFLNEKAVSAESLCPLYVCAPKAEKVK